MDQIMYYSHEFVEVFLNMCVTNVYGLEVV